MNANLRATPWATAALCAAIATCASPPTAGMEGRGDVVVRVDISGRMSDRGIGVLRLRADACTVITPKHVITPALSVPNAHVIVQTADGTTTTAEVVYLDAPGDLTDLSILKLPAEYASLCARSTLEQAHSIEPYLRSDSLALDVVEDGGRTRRIPLYLTGFDDATVEIASRLPTLPLLDGYSGAMVRMPDGQPVAMLTAVDGTSGFGRAYRWDYVLTRLARWYLLADDVEPNCQNAPFVTVADGASLPSVAPSDLHGWTAGNVTRRLAAAPVLHIVGRLNVDTDEPIIACRLELAAGARVVRVGSTPLRVLALEVAADASAAIESLGADGSSPEGAAASGSAGQSFDPSSRRGCDGTRHGAPGENGPDGHTGGDGGTSGGVILAVARVTGPLVIRSIGGKGGKGQTGGAGGPGGAGQGASSGSSSAFDCKCGGSPGGRGGDGGPGGRGGNGGRGGASGPITGLVGVYSVPLAPTSAGGIGGAPGSGGTPGVPGPGGSGSSGTGYCSGQRGSTPGDIGVAGAEGAPGHDGDTGPVRVREFSGGKDLVDWPGFLFAVQGEFPMLFDEPR